MSRVTNTGTVSNVSIGTSAAVIAAGRSGREGITIQNAHASNTLYVGTTDAVTTSNGVKVPAGASLSIGSYNGPVYGIASGASTDVRYWDGSGDIDLSSGSDTVTLSSGESAGDPIFTDVIDRAARDLGRVDIADPLPAGTNAIGKLAANSGVDIGDVDVLTVPADPFGANADAAATAGGTGSIQAKLRNATALLDAIKTAVETLDNTVGGSELQVDVVGSLPAGTNNIGDVDILSIAAGDNNIGNVDLASAIPAGSNTIGKVDHTTTGIGSGRKVVTTAGTRVALATTTLAKWVTITAETDNTGYVVVGSAAGVIAALGTREGVPLAAGDSITLPLDDLADVGLDSTVNGDGVTFTYGT